VVQILDKHSPVKDPQVYDQMRPAGLDPAGKRVHQSLRDDLAYYERRGQVRERVELAGAWIKASMNMPSSSLVPIADPRVPTAASTSSWTVAEHHLL